jgi:hypothetical protein
MVFNKGMFVVRENVQQTAIGCSICFSGIANEHNHKGSPFCEEGSIASGGKWAHCQCDTCRDVEGFFR